MIWVRVDAGVVVERVRVPPRNVFAANYAAQFIEAPDVVEVGWTCDGTDWQAPAPDPAAVQKAMIDAVQRHLDATAQQRGYDGILSLASYAASSNTPFAAEGDAGLAWRDAVWLHCYQVLAEVNDGTRPIPTEAELLAELPEMVWP